MTYTAGEHGFIAGPNPQQVDPGGEGATVTAVPDEGHHFKGWSDGVTTASRTDAEVTSDLKVTASFAVNHYTLTYTAGEHGSIEGASPQTVEHGEAGGPVRAVPAEHYHFAAWSDGGATPERTDSGVISDLSVLATFAIDQYTLSYAAGEHGSIEGPSPQRVDHGSNGAKVTAVPDEGYHFESWSDGVATAGRTDAEVTSDLKVTASFAINQYTLSYTVGEHGTIEGASPQTVVHGSAGSPVRAVPAEHYHFAGWSDGVATPERTDTEVASDLSVTANFAIDQYTLTYTAGEHGSIRGANPQEVDWGGDGRMVTAVPDVGYHFAGWSDGVDTISRTDTDVTADHAATASFAINRYTLTYIAGDHGSIEGASPQTVAHGGAAAPVTAVPEEGYHFVSWSDGVDTAQRTDSEITGELTVSASFEVNTYIIGGTLSGLMQDTQTVLQNNGGDELTLTANGEFRFAVELLNGAAYEVSVLAQPVSPNQICTVTNGSGVVSEEDVLDVKVECVPVRYTIGGVVSGLAEGDRVVLRNKREDLEIKANGTFTFPEPLDDGSEYEVKVYRQPKKPHWTCDVENGAGTLAGENVTDITIDCYAVPILEATAGVRKVKLKWNSEDYSGVTFNLCRAQEEIPAEGLLGCQNLEGGVLETRASNPLTAANLTNDIPYWFQLEVQTVGGRRRLSEVVKAMPFGGLNDTGIDWCANDTTNRFMDGTRSEKTEACHALATNHPGQDAFYGRDALARVRKLPKTGYGSAGFDFTKLCRSGQVAGEGKCPPNPAPGPGRNDWACTRDNVTGLLWEVKTASGLQGRNNTYTWYNPEKQVNGGQVGMKNGGTCEGSDCDTLAYVQAVNEQGLCGVGDWRLPTRRELLSIVENGHFKPAVDSHFFPNTLSSYYWSSSPSPEEEDAAWQVYFLYGEASPNDKKKSNHIRLVRGRTVTFGLDNP